MDELLERIRDIRASKKGFYRKVKDVYSLYVDYNPAFVSIKDFFAIAQIKLFYAVIGQTATEFISEMAVNSK